MVKFLVFILIITLVFRLVTRWLIPMFLSSFLGRMTDRMSDVSNQYNQNTDNRSEGDVIIENTTSRENPTSQQTDDRGDYVDFEEVE